MLIEEILKSKEDRTVKYLLRNSKRQLMEISHIDKRDGKDILCVPTQSNCAMSCKFCHTVDMAGQVKVENLSVDDLLDALTEVHKHLVVAEEGKPLLISFMGSGEPLKNLDNILEVMTRITNSYRYPVRFALATIFPKGSFGDFVKFAEEVADRKINLKVHLSLHYTDAEQRKEWMPMASGIKTSLSMLEWYKAFTGNAVEIHYTLIDGQNNTERDSFWLGQTLEGRQLPLKLLHYSERAAISEWNHVGKFAAHNFSLSIQAYAKKGITIELYDPPGRDIGASCGQFLVEKYIQEGLVTINA